MSVIKQTDQAPETIDSRPMCECHDLKAAHGWCARSLGRWHLNQDSTRCVKHGPSARPAIGRFLFDVPMADQGGLEGKLSRVSANLCDECAKGTRVVVVDQIGGQFWEV